MSNKHRLAGQIRYGLASILAVAALQPHLCRAVDTEPGSYTAPPPGVNSLGLYYHHYVRDQQFVNGVKQQNHPELVYDVTQVKYSHAMQLGDYTVAPGFILTCGRTEAGGDIAKLGSANGCADLLLGGVFWAINAPERKNYFGISPYVYAPTGAYDKNQGLNAGENRWKYGVNAGYITPLSERFTLDLVGDILWSGRNNDYGAKSATLEQGVVYNLQFHLRYQIDEAMRIFASYLHDWGGETSVNGVDRHDRKNQGRYRVGAARYIDRQQLVQFDIGADTHTENGYKEKNRLILRYVLTFL